MKIIRKTYRFAAGVSLAFLAALTLSSALLVYQGHQTLELLTTPGQGARSLEVYSRWLDLDPAHPVSRAQITAWLQAAGYEAVPTLPEKPGQYQETAGGLDLFTRPFVYPDGPLPLQKFELKFTGEQLSAVEGGNGQTLGRWRLEPKLLARWAADPSALRVRVRVSELPPFVPGAVIAVEDRRFFKHGAFDPIGMARALWVDLRHAQLRQGASTLSQQLARSIFLDVNRTWRRKVQEAALAFYLEARYSKPQLLEMYLNQVYWGQDNGQALLGIESASRAYFAKPARQLSVAESALLAGLLQSPNHLSPRVAPEPALERRNRVLRLMREQGVIPPEAFQKALAEPLRLAPPAKKSGEAAYFLTMLRDQLSDRYSLPVLMSQGWKVYTTLDPTLQPAASQAIASVAPPVRAKSAAPPDHPEGALVALDPHSGAILAWVGGTDFATSPFDRVATAHRQPGSAFKPFVVLSALESKKFTPISVLEDKPLTVKTEHGPWTPQNYDHKFRGVTTVRDALVYSLNVPMVRLAIAAGLPRVVETAHRAGIESPLRPVPSLALGTSEVSALELTDAYATLAAGGPQVAPYAVEAVLDGDGKAVELHRSEPKSGLMPEATALVTQMLEDVLREGTGKAAAQALGFQWPVAGKTGTSENYQDAWFMGYSPDLVCGVWVGYDRPKSLGRSAAGIALPVWIRFMNQALGLRGVRPFEEPNALIWKTIDPASGLLAVSGCPNRKKVAFVPGTEPTKDCPLHSGGIVGFFKRLTGRTSPAVK